jgi:acyl-CoA reductase-like NAD-dependent aldehyde dehydrogenase
MKHFHNLLNGKILKDGTPFEVISPIDKTHMGYGYLVSSNDFTEAFKKSTTGIINNPLSTNVLQKLGEYIKYHKKKFIEQITLETGYIRNDSEDIVEGSIELVNHFTTYLHDTAIQLPKGKFSYSHKGSRQLQIKSVPYGIVAVMTPQNAPLILELTVLLNTLAAGNKIILRPSSQCVGTAALLIEGLLDTFPEEILQRVSIISCKATDFLNLSYEKANLIHYIGSSRHGARILTDSLKHNVKALVDGEGSSTVVVDKTASFEEAVAACHTGIIRSNGELCSTIRTIVVEQSLYKAFRTKLIEKLKNVTVGDPRHKSINMGPVFHQKQAENLLEVVKKYKVISGNLNSHILGRNYITPLLCELEENGIDFLHEDVYGPIAGIVSYKNDEWKKWLNESPYYLNHAVFSEDKKFIDDFIASSPAPRIVINHDPSIESAFEPWGAFLPSGQNDVSFWYNKYTKNIQIDS